MAGRAAGRSLGQRRHGRLGRLLVVVSIASKLGAVLAYPPAPGLRGRRALATGALLQCKGLMEIVAATILHQRGMVSNFAYASLMLLAVISTVLTGPMFRLFNGGTSRE